MAVMRCEECGSQVVLHVASCSQCGAKDSAEATDVEMRREARSGRKLFWMVIAAVAIGAAIAHVLYPFGLLVVGVAGGVAGWSGNDRPGKRSLAHGRARAGRAGFAIVAPEPARRA